MSSKAENKWTEMYQHDRHIHSYKTAKEKEEQKIVSLSIECDFVMPTKACGFSDNNDHSSKRIGYSLVVWNTGSFDRLRCGLYGFISTHNTHNTHTLTIQNWPVNSIEK